MSSHTIGPRVVGEFIQLAGRPWNDVAPELQRHLHDLVSASDAAAVIIQQFQILVNASGEVSVEPASGSDMGRTFMLMGA